MRHAISVATPATGANVATSHTDNLSNRAVKPNAALNILRLGLQAIEKESRARTERSEDAPLRSLRL